MNTYYADDTYAKATKEDAPRKIHLFGGIVVHRDTETSLIQAIRDIKSKYTHPNMPIKWNFKDKLVNKKYEEYKRQDEYKIMLTNSREWRLSLFKEIQNFEYTILASCIESHSENPKTIQKIKNDLNTYCFENVLMRLGLDAKENGGNWQCVLDWPPDNDSKPFDTGYYQLFHFGKASSPNPAICGPLEKLGFSHSLHFTRTNHSPLMQLADLTIGAIRDHIECKIQGRESCVGTEAVEIFYDHIRNKNGKIPNYGIIPSSGSRQLKTQIEAIFSEKTKPQRSG